MSKKAQGLSINVIIVAAIALIVLVVLVAIFTGRLGIFTQEVEEVGQGCTEFKNAEGEAAAWVARTCTGDETEVFTATDAGDHPGEHCCLEKVAEE